jgi:hypothetical protein
VAFRTGGSPWLIRADNRAERSLFALEMHAGVIVADAAPALTRGLRLCITLRVMFVRAVLTTLFCFALALFGAITPAQHMRAHADPAVSAAHEAHHSAGGHHHFDADELHEDVTDPADANDDRAPDFGHAAELHVYAIESDVATTDTPWITSGSPVQERPSLWSGRILSPDPRPDRA